MRVDIHRVPVRVALSYDAVRVIVDSWDSDFPIEFPLTSLPNDVIGRLLLGYEFVVAEAVVNLNAVTSHGVIHSIEKLLPVPTDEEMGF